MRVGLNHQKIPREPRRRFYLGASMIGLVAGALFIVLGVHFLQLLQANRQSRVEAAQVERQIGDLQRERRELEQFFKRPENDKLHDRAMYVNSLIDDRSFDWTQMFMDLERLMPAGARIVSLDPKLAGDHVELKMVIAATSEEAKLKFLQTLETSKELRSEEHTSELQSLAYLVCRLLLEKKKNTHVATIFGLWFYATRLT